LPRPIGIIQKPGFFEDLLVRTGVNRPQQPFVLDGDVVPVIIADSGVAFVASPSPPYRVADIFTAGLLVNPALATVTSDTGPLPVGSYTLKILLYSDVSLRWDIQWRDAANAVNLWTQILSTGPNPNIRTLIMDIRFEIVNVNERFRILTNNAVAAGDLVQSTLAAKI